MVSFGHRIFDVVTLSSERAAYRFILQSRCAVAATGLPDPRHDHAVQIVRFANTCLFRVNALTRVLESALGCVQVLGLSSWPSFKFRLLRTIVLFFVTICTVLERESLR